MAELQPLLIVEDNEDDTFLFEVALKEAGFANPVFFVNGYDEALKFLKGEGDFSDRKAYPLPKIVLLDVRLPKYSGFDLLAWIRAQEKIRTLIVVMVSASSEEKDIARAYRLGANSYLNKPAEPEKFVELLRNFRTYWIDSNRYAG